MYKTWCPFSYQAYRWEANESAVEWLENQKRTDSTVLRNIYAVKKDAIISQIQESLSVSSSLPMCLSLQTTDLISSFLFILFFIRTVRKQRWMRQSVSVSLCRPHSVARWSKRSLSQISTIRSTQALDDNVTIVHNGSARSDDVKPDNILSAKQQASKQRQVTEQRWQDRRILRRRSTDTHTFSELRDKLLDQN